MLPTPAIHAADRLITVLMILVEAVARIGFTSTPTFPAKAAITLFLRLSSLVTTLIRISNFGIRAPREPKPAAPSRLQPAPAAPPDRSAPIPSLPRRPGWLLAALPDLAPGIAADLEILLADPAFAALIDAAPSLNRILRPLMRALGLAATPSPNDPPPGARPTAPRPPPHPAPPPAKPNPAPPSRCVESDPVSSRLIYVQFITLS